MYEYLVVTTKAELNNAGADRKLEDELNALGRESWKLVGMQTTGNRILRMTFMREAWPQDEALENAHAARRGPSLPSAPAQPPKADPLGLG